MSDAVVHELKCWPKPFQAVVERNKRHEVRKFDREFREGDIVVLHEWNPDTNSFTGRTFSGVIGYITKPGTWSLPQDVGVFSIVDC